MMPPPSEQIRELAEILQLLLAHVAGQRRMSVMELEVCQEALKRILEGPR